MYGSSWGLFNVCSRQLRLVCGSNVKVYTMALSLFNYKLLIQIVSCLSELSSPHERIHT